MIRCSLLLLLFVVICAVAAPSRINSIEFSGDHSQWLAGAYPGADAVSSAAIIGVDTKNIYRMAVVDEKITVRSTIPLDPNLSPSSMVLYTITDADVARVIMASRSDPTLLYDVDLFLNNTLNVRQQIHCSGVNPDTVWTFANGENALPAPGGTYHVFFGSTHQLALVNVDYPRQCMVMDLRQGAVEATQITGLHILSQDSVCDIFIARVGDDPSEGGHLLRIRQKLYGPWPYAPGLQTFTYLQQAPRPTFAGLDGEGTVMIFWVETDGETGYLYSWDDGTKALNIADPVQLGGQSYLPIAVYHNNYALVVSVPDNTQSSYFVHGYALDRLYPRYLGNVEETNAIPPAALLSDAAANYVAAVALTRDVNTNNNEAILYGFQTDAQYPSRKSSRPRVAPQPPSWHALNSTRGAVPPSPPTCTAATCGPTAPCDDGLCCCEFARTMYCCGIVPGAATCVP